MTILRKCWKDFISILVRWQNINNMKTVHGIFCELLMTKHIYNAKLVWLLKGVFHHLRPTRPRVQNIPSPKMHHGKYTSLLVSSTCMLQYELQPKGFPHWKDIVKWSTDQDLRVPRSSVPTCKRKSYYSILLVKKVDNT